MLGDTFVLPQAGGDITLKKINQDGYSSEYLFRDTASEYTVRVRHTKTKATATRAAYDRHNLEVVQRVYADGETPEFERKFYFVIEHKPGDVPTPLVDAVADKVIASTNALVTALLGWES